MKNKNIKPLNSKGQAHGYCEVYWCGTEKLMFKGTYINGQEVGLFIDKTNFGKIDKNSFNKIYFIP